MYKRLEYLQSNDCKKQSLARNHEGLDWNYAIAPILDRDLHEKLLPFDSSILIGFVSILPLISSGYFETAKNQISAIACDESLAAVQAWLIQALDEADDINNSSTEVENG